MSAVLAFAPPTATTRHGERVARKRSVHVGFENVTDVTRDEGDDLDILSYDQGLEGARDRTAHEHPDPEIRQTMRPLRGRHGGVKHLLLR